MADAFTRVARDYVNGLNTPAARGCIIVVPTQTRSRAGADGMKILIQYLAVALGGSLGAMARLAVASACGRLLGTAFPVGTFIINISGSLFLGWFLTIIGNRIVISDTTRIGIAVGFVGAYTTFSTYMYESMALLENGSAIKAVVNLLGSLLVGLAAVRAGMWLGAH
jgi:CrcB protein